MAVNASWLQAPNMQPCDGVCAALRTSELKKQAWAVDYQYVIIIRSVWCFGFNLQSASEYVAFFGD